MRTAFIETLCQVAETDERVWLLTGDLGYSVLEPFKERFPSRFINAGVAEQNMTGVAAGLALSGKVVFTYSIANFPTLRCLEQIRNDICYHRASVKIVSIGAGFSYGAHGYTHHGIEDLAIMRALPGMSVVAPGDPAEARVATRALADADGPGYLRLGKAGEPAIHAPGTDLEAGKIIEVRPGEEVGILVTGALLANAVEAADVAREDGLGVAVYSVPWVQPLDEVALRDIASRMRVLITVEEALQAGGLGGSVAEVLAGLPAGHARLIRRGVGNTLLEGAHGQASARARFGLDTQGLLETVRSAASGEFRD